MLHQTATLGSYVYLPASEPANFLSGLACVANEARFPGTFVQKTTTMRRTNRLQNRQVWAFSSRFLRAMIGEWLFPMHIAEMPARLHQTERL